MLDLELYLTDSKSESDGVWSPILGGLGKVKVARWFNENHIRKTVEMTEGLELDEMTEKEKEELDLKIEAEAVFLDFEGFSKGGQPLENSLENRIAILRAKDLRWEIKVISKNRENYLEKKIREAAEKLGES